jgi:hypothetical protein
MIQNQLFQDKGACEDRKKEGGYAVKPVKKDQVKKDQGRGDML